MENYFKNLNLEHWTRIFFMVGIAGVILALTKEIKVVSNQDLLLFSAGVLFIGLGEVINHEWHTHIIPPNAAIHTGLIGEGLIRHPSFLGCLIDVIGVLSFATLIYLKLNHQTSQIKLLIM